MQTPTLVDAVTCPFCGLACDDVRVRVADDSLEVVANGCAISKAAFSRASSLRPGHEQAHVAGRPVSLQTAIEEAARILGASRQPLFTGLATDVAGMRAVLQLADRIGATLDHMNSDAKMRNLLALQDVGWISTTLAEVKNRADLLVLAGTDAVTRFPRFFERVVWVDDTLFAGAPAMRSVVYLGDPQDTRPGTAPDGRVAEVIRFDNAKLPEVVAALRAVSLEQPLRAGQVAGVPLSSLSALYAKMRAARYGVLVWAAADLDFAHAELTVQGLVQLLRTLNQSTRFAALPLGGSEGDVTIDAAHIWQTGYPFRTSLASGHPEYDPYYYAAQTMLARAEADTQLWISSFNDQRVLEPCSVPTVVLAPPGLRWDWEPQVRIAVGAPGIDHAGTFFRCDKVVALPLRKLRASPLLSVASVIDAIRRHLPSAEAAR
jgi:formylmethanofuran dehydrogenase subunit B